MAVTSNIVFAIGTLGASKAKVNFAMVAGAITLVGAAFGKLIKSGQEYQQLLDRLTVDMAAYNKATKGMIDTTEGLVGANRLAQAGFHATAEEMKAFGVAAIQHSKATGKNVDQAFAEIVKGVSKGGARMKEFGLDIQNTEDLMLGQRETADKLVAKYGEMEVQVETVAEKMKAFGNNLGTFADQQSATFAATFAGTEIFEGLSGVLEHTTERYEATGGAISFVDGVQMGFVTTLYRTTDALGVTTNAVEGYLKPLVILEMELRRAVSLGREIAQTTAIVDKNIESFNKSRSETAASKKIMAALDAGDLEGAKAALAEGQALGMGLKEMEDALYGRSKKTGGGGGRRKRKKTQAEKDIELIEGYGAPTGESFAPDVDIYEDPFFADELAAEERAQKKIDIEQEMRAKQLEVSKTYHAQELALAKQAAAEHKILQLSRVQAAATAMGNLSSLMETENKKAFAVGKAAAIGQAVINTALAAVKAFQSMASIPLVGPALGAAAAAAAVAAGAVQIAKIRNTKLGSAAGSFSGGGSMGAGGGGVYTPTTGGTNNIPTSQLSGGTPQTINLVLNDEVLMSAMTTVNDNASQKGQAAFATG